MKQVEVLPGRRQHFDLAIPPLQDWNSQGWYSGNTHTHYNLGMDENPDDRLRIVPTAEALDFSFLTS